MNSGPASRAGGCSLLLMFAVLLLCRPALAGAGGGVLSADRGLQSVTLQLKWRHQFQSAGYYAAIERGYYRDAGLDVTLREPDVGEEPAEVVLRGDAEYGVATSDLVRLRAAGMPVVALIAIYQHSPLVLLALSDIDSVHELAHRRIMLEPHSAELLAYLRDEGVPIETIEFVTHTFDPDDLLAGKVDAISAYLTDEPYLIRQAGHEYRLFSPRAGGIDFYGDTLFTTEAEIRRNPQRVRAFIDATRKGWNYALENPDEIIDLIYDKYSQRHSREHLRYEAIHSMRLILPELIEIGHMNPGRWQYIADTYQSLGLLDGTFDLGDFLFDYETEVTPAWLWPVLFTVLVAALLLVLFVVRAHWLNRQLQAEIRERQHLEQELIKLASTDSLTGVANRRHFLRRLENEMLRSRRSGRAFSLLVIDLDHFKQINDTHGHAAGDAVLVHFTRTVTDLLRRVDVFGRTGGEEFAVLLPETDLDGAVQLAERLRYVVAESSFEWEGHPLPITISIGATSSYATEEADDLLRRADKALYQAKKTGRNRVVSAESG